MWDMYQNFTPTKCPTFLNQKNCQNIHHQNSFTQQKCKKISLILFVYQFVQIYLLSKTSLKSKYWSKSVIKLVKQEEYSANVTEFWGLFVGRSMDCCCTNFTKQYVQSI